MVVLLEEEEEGGGGGVGSDIGGSCRRDHGSKQSCQVTRVAVFFSLIFFSDMLKRLLHARSKESLLQISIFKGDNFYCHEYCEDLSISPECNVRTCT